MHKVLIIGCGGIGLRHLKGYELSKRSITSIVEPNDEKRKLASSTFGVVEQFRNISEVNLNKFDLAVICTPANTHLDLMHLCMQKNLPFMVEKPLAVTKAGIRGLVDEVKANKLVAHVGYVRRVTDQLQTLRAQIQNGKIGDLKLAYLNSSQEFPKYRPDFQKTYYAKPEMGGGAILDAASHIFDLLIWIMGVPAEVSCMYDKLVLQGTETEDTCLINIRFASGTMANVTIKQFQKPNTNRYEFIGTKGNLVLDHSNLMFFDSDGPDATEVKDFMEGMVPMDIHQETFTLQAHAMLDAIEGLPCNLATLDEAYLNLHLALAAKRSWDERKVISALLEAKDAD